MARGCAVLLVFLLFLLKLEMNGHKVLLTLNWSYVPGGCPGAFQLSMEQLRLMVAFPLP